MDEMVKIVKKMEPVKMDNNQLLNQKRQRRKQNIEQLLLVIMAVLQR
jgi:hypothetical protein